MCFFFEVWISRKKDQQHIELANPDKMKSYASRIFTAASSQTKRGLVAVFLWSSSRVKRNLLSKFSLLHLDLDHPRMFCFPNWRAFSWTKKNEAKTNDDQFKNQIYQCEFFPQQSLAHVWHEFGSQTPTNPKNSIWTCFSTSCNFYGCFWGAMEIEKVAVVISLLVVSWVKNSQTKPKRKRVKKVMFPLPMIRETGLLYRQKGQLHEQPWMVFELDLYNAVLTCGQRSSLLIHAARSSWIWLNMFEPIIHWGWDKIETFTLHVHIIQSRMSSSLTLSRSVPTLGSRQVENEPVS